jgi:hypothetical protein
MVIIPLSFNITLLLRQYPRARSKQQKNTRKIATDFNAKRNWRILLNLIVQSFEIKEKPFFLPSQPKNSSSLQKMNDSSPEQPFLFRSSRRKNDAFA